MTSPLLDREEYIEQAYFFRVYRERLEQNLPSQEILKTIQEEVLATTRLPMAIDFLKGEILLTGHICGGMRRLAHYFTPFQTFVMSKSEQDRSQFDQRIALLILEREVEYRAAAASPAGMFVYQFECLARNRLGYDDGLDAMAGDPIYDDAWQRFIRRTRLSLGNVDFAEVIYRNSEHFANERRRILPAEADEVPPGLFGEQEGRIARANRGKDPLFMFAALQRQLGYPRIPRRRPASDRPIIHPAVEQRLQQIEKRIKLLEAEQKGGIDLSEFYRNPPTFDGDVHDIESQ